MKNKGISLITLIITIVVVIILATAVILTLGNKNPVNDANLAALLSNKDNMQGKILFHVSKKTAALPERDLNAKTILITDVETNIIDNTVPVREVTKDGKKIYLYRVDKNKYKNNTKEDVAEKPSTGSEWYVDEYGVLYLVYDYITSVPNYMKDGNKLSKNLEDFVIVTGDLLEKSIVDSVVISDTAENGVLEVDFKKVEKFASAWISVNGTADKLGSDTNEYSRQLDKNITSINLGTESLGNKYAHLLVLTEETNVEIVKKVKITKAADKWDGSVATGFESGSGTQDNPYIIKTASQFAFFASTGTQYYNKYINLISDIDLDNREWTPIGEGLEFSGIFDGCGHNIYNLKISTGSHGYCGLFSNTSQHVTTIKNLNLVSGSITVGGTNGTGGIIGQNDGGVILNCFNGVNINVSTGTVGGITGSGRGDIYNCCNYGNIQSTNETIGGIIGGYYRGNVKNSYNVGLVSGSNYVGGISGSVGSESQISNCYNKGMVIGSGTRIGGISGLADSNNTLYCYNLATVQANDEVGGIIGHTPKTTINYCCNKGEIISSNTYKGSIVGYCGGSRTSYLYLTENYYLSGTSAKGIGYNAVGSTADAEGELSAVDSEADMPSVLSIINGESAFTEDTNNINDGDPILTWQAQ